MNIIVIVIIKTEKNDVIIIIHSDRKRRSQYRNKGCEKGDNGRIYELQNIYAELKCETEKLYQILNNIINV
jgi:hypothetical protein